MHMTVSFDVRNCRYDLRRRSGCASGVAGVFQKRARSVGFLGRVLVSSAQCRARVSNEVQSKSLSTPRVSSTHRQNPRGTSQLAASLRDQVSDQRSNPLLSLLPVAGLGLMIGLGLAYRQPVTELIEVFADYLRAMGPAGYVLFIAVYTGLELLAIPAIPLTMTAGALFGVVPGTIAASIGATAAATGSFLASRYFLREKILELASDNPTFLTIDRVVGKEGFKMVLMLRLSPLLPLSLSNYIYGLTSVELRPYVLGSWLGMLPGTFLYVQTGAVGMSLMESGMSAETGSQLLPLIVGLGTTALTASYITKVVKEALDEDEDAVSKQ
eukprot:CAMPEP_0114239730 /NCGR_PEP_ID=MMETSP0058-20121206/8634_1 /TAXON_ID=36894 /ORGANISM="Pyramimonas parkeae, CCMP726" /LENGTH=326 /DNA_ID=CAMNT_0001351967 /DNA_START=193 /DNA_END=1173 /DNA_ORIENTATION=-